MQLPAMCDTGSGISLVKVRDIPTMNRMGVIIILPV